MQIYDDLVLFTNTPMLTECLLYSLEYAARGIDLYVIQINSKWQAVEISKPFHISQ